MFHDGQADEVIKRGEPGTTLTAFFNLNVVDDGARKYLYHELPEHYTWNSKTKKWNQRKRGEGN